MNTICCYIQKSVTGIEPTKHPVTANTDESYGILGGEPYRVTHKYLNPGRGISASGDTSIIFCMAFKIDKINIS